MIDRNETHLSKKSTRSVEFKLAVPNRIAPVIDEMLDLSITMSNAISKDISEHLTDWVQRAEVTKEQKRPYDYLYASEKEGIRYWYKHSGLRDKMYFDFCSKYFGYPVLKNKNAHFLTRTIENVAAAYEGRFTRFQEETKIRATDQSQLTEEEELLKKNIKEILNIMCSLKPGQTVDQILVRRSKTGKNQEKYQKLLSFYVDVTSDEKSDKYINFDILFADMCYRNSATFILKTMEISVDDSGVVNFGMVSPLVELPTKIGSSEEATMRHILENRSVRLINEVNDMIFELTVAQYIKSSCRYRFVDELTEKANSKDSVFHKNLLMYYTSHRDKVDEGYKQYLHSVNESFGKKQIVWKNSTLKLNYEEKVEKDRQVPIKMISSIKQFADLGITSISGCKYVLRVHMILDDEKKFKDQHLFCDLYDKRTGRRFDLLDHETKGYAYIPIMVPENDRRTYDISDFDCQMTEISSRDGMYFAKLTRDIDYVKPVNRFGEEQVCGVDINIRHAMIDVSERSIMNSEKYVDVEGFIIDYFRNVKNLPSVADDLVTNRYLGEAEEAGKHTFFGLMSSINKSISRETGGLKNRFVKNVDGTYTILPDCFSEPLNVLMKKYEQGSLQYRYVASVKALRVQLAQMHVLCMEHDDRRQVYDNLYGKPYIDDHPYEDPDFVYAHRKLHQKIETNTQFIVSYAIQLIQEAGFSCISVEQIDKKNLGKMLNLKSAKVFYNGCIYASSENGQAIADTRYFRTNCRYFDYPSDLNLFDIDHIKLNGVGEAYNINAKLMNSLGKYVGFASFKHMFAHIGTAHDVQVVFVEPAFTSQVDSKTGELRADKKEMRPYHHTYKHTDGTVSHADENGAINAKKIVTEEILRTRLLKENSVKDIMEYGGVQLERSGKSINGVRKVYEEVYAEKNGLV